MVRSAILRYLMENIFWFVSMPLISMKFRSRILRRIGIRIGHNSLVAQGCYIGSERVEIGDNVFINIRCFLDGSGRVVIGDFARIAPYVKILTVNHPLEPSVIRRQPGRDFPATTVIGRGCWIGASAVILAGVKVAEGCVVAAGAVVTSDTQPNGLYAGVPARRMRDLPVDDE